MLQLNKSKQELRFVWSSGPLLEETTHGGLETNFVTLAASFVLSFRKEETISEGSVNWYVSKMHPS